MKERKMKGARMPQDHFEREVNDLDSSNMKYASESTMDNPQDLKKAADGLAKFAKNHQMKY